MIGRYSGKVLQISAKSDTLIFFSKTALTSFLVFGLKLVLSMTFNLNETYFFWKIYNLEIFDLEIVKTLPKLRFSAIFSTFASFVFLDSARWAWCVVVFLQFASPFNVFLFHLKRLFPSQDIQIFSFTKTISRLLYYIFTGGESNYALQQSVNIQHSHCHAIIFHQEI